MEISKRGSGLTFGLALLLCASAAPAHAEPLTRDECRVLLRLDTAREPIAEAAAHNLAAAALNTAGAGGLRRTAEALLAPPSSGGSLDADRLCRSLVVEPVTTALLTGYYVPVVPARRTRDPEFRYPLYALPDAAQRDLSRAEIDRGALADRVPAIAWLSDPVEVFFIHIQGSALLELPEGRMSVGYAGSNGRPYTSIGALLVSDGRMRREDVSMETLKEYLRSHHEERDAILHANERYIYFRELDGDPVGSLGVPLTAHRSVAADPAVYPPGSLLFLRPVDGSTGIGARLVFVQDRGSAITGPDRLDLFVGTGEEAGRIAGPLQQRVEVFALRTGP